MSFPTQPPPSPPIYTVCVYLYLVTLISKLTGPLVFNEVFRGFIPLHLDQKFKAVERLLACVESFCFLELVNILKFLRILSYKGWRTKCHTVYCACNTFLLLQKHLTSGTELILISWKTVPNEEHVQCDHRFASQPLANEPLHSSQLFDTSLQKARGTTSLCGP